VIVGNENVKKWRGSQQVPTLLGISHEHYAVHATQLFFTSQVNPMLMSSVPHAWGTLDRKSTLFKTIVNFFSEGRCFHVLAGYCVYRVALLCDKF